MYCENCGKSIPENAQFCSNCGAQQTAKGQADSPVAAAADQPNRSAAQKQGAEQTKKKVTKKTVGIVLLCLQAVAILGSIANGELQNLMQLFTAGPMGIVEVLGFFLPAIIGAILLIVDYKKRTDSK